MKKKKCSDLDSLSRYWFAFSRMLYNWNHRVVASITTIGGNPGSPKLQTQTPHGPLNKTPEHLSHPPSLPLP